VIVRRWIELPVRRRFESFQSGSGPELLLVHPGGPGLTTEYLEALLHLGGNRFRVLLLNPRGVGGSWRPLRSRSYTLEGQARDVEAIRRALRVPRIHLLGFSAGGFAALEYARRFPRRLSSLLLCGTAGSAEELREANRLMRGAASAADLRELRSFERTRQFDSAEYAALAERIGRPFQARFLPGGAPPLGKLSIRVYRTMMTRSGDEFRVDGNLRAWDARSLYRRLRVPTLVLIGRYDFFYSAARRAAREIPGARLVVLPRSSHLSILEEPEAFLRAVTHFLRDVVPPSRSIARPPVRGDPRGREGGRRRRARRGGVRPRRYRARPRGGRAMTSHRPAATV
jgi:proline iminopeptidase